MKNKSPILVPEFREMLAARNAQALRDFCETGHPALVAELISALAAEETLAVLMHVDLPLCAEIFRHLDDDLMVEMIETLRRDEIARLLSEMPHDERADLFKQLLEKRRQAVLPVLAQAERVDIRRLTAYMGRHCRSGHDLGLRHPFTAIDCFTGNRASQRSRTGQRVDLLRLCGG